MRFLIHFIVVAIFFLAACNTRERSAGIAAQNLDTLLNRYWEERMQLFPLEATGYGDNRYNDRFTITIAGSFRDSLSRFYTRYLRAIDEVDSASLNDEARLSFNIFRYEMQMGLEGLKYPTHLMPINQFWSPTLDMPLLGSGAGNQPFKTVADYDAWLLRVSHFPAWADTAIANMQQGIRQGWVLPESLVKKVLPQLKSMLAQDVSQSTFYGPVSNFPAAFSAAEKDRLTVAYARAINTVVFRTYKKLYDFMAGEYLRAARSTPGIGALANGRAYYDYCIRYWTTTTLSADSIYQLGLSEVARIEKEMNHVKDATGFKGTLRDFFAFLSDDRQFYPFATAEAVLDSFRAVQHAEEATLKKLFDKTPRTAFTIRQTEAFRAASASAEYNPPSEDGSRPGIFYVPVLDARKFNAVGMETLFLHEAIPGHHYQIALQQEATTLPKFRKFLWYGAYGEGWAMYAESLGKELGLFSNPYQYFGHLSDAMHRAIRLVVDVGMHAKSMTREEAIQYMMAHERISEEEATSEIERYMAIPGQALSYKIGQLNISALRTKYEQQLGAKFSLPRFHDEVLRHGCVPVALLIDNLAAWAHQQ